MESVKYNMSANKAIIETHVATRRYYNCTRKIIEKTTTIVAPEAMSNLTVIF